MILLSGIEKEFTAPGRQPVRALAGVDLAIEDGEFVAIVGPSGAGKSTLLNLLGMLDAPTGGTYLLDGRDVTGLGGRARDSLRSQTFGFVFQESHMIAAHTVASNIALAPMIQGLGIAECEQRVHEGAADAGISHRLMAPARTLSGGERQRAAIARALAGHPAVLLADEPTGNLDQANSQAVIGLLRELNARGLTIVVITHDPNVAEAARRRVTLVDGRIVADTGDAARSTRAASPSVHAVPRARRRRGARWGRSIWEAMGGVLLSPARSMVLIASFLLGSAGLVAATGLSQTAATQVSARITQAQLDEVRVGSLEPRKDDAVVADIERLDHVAGVATVRTCERGDCPVTRFDPVRVPGSSPAQARVMSVDQAYLRVAGLQVKPRSAAQTFDRPYTRTAALLGHQTAAELGIARLDGTESVWIAGRPFAVLGIVVGSLRGEDNGHTVFLPESFGETGSQHYVVRTDPGYPAAIARAIPLAVAPANPGSVDVSTVADLSGLRRGVAQDLGILVAVISAVLLAMATLGGAAAMNLSVRARVPEIALRRALGASKGSVARQFLTEGVILGLAGGLGGVAVGTLATVVVSAASHWSPVLSPLLAAVGAGAGFISGALAGIVPALSASRQEPAQAVRPG